MNNPLVSVIIPTYKRPDMIFRAVNSVLKQTYDNIEIFVVDDNNPKFPEREATEEVMSQFKNNHNVIYLKHDKNRNGSAARNTGWRISSGKYITFLDDDDEISPNKIQKQVECLESLDDSWGACYTAYHTLMKDGSIQRSTTNQSGDIYLRALMRTFYVGSGSNILLRKKVIDEIGGYDESFKRNQDIEFMTRAFENYKVAYINEDLLTIHWEVRTIKRTYEFVEDVATHYIYKMKERINQLTPYDQHRVLAVIALDRARVALKFKEYKDLFRILKENKVTFGECCKYVCYLVKRVCTKKSYGFYLD
ncbi:glycosyltransferase family 2 protein [Macellibacteroides fermentans]|uniref:Glycosyltransferase involved in cell wall biosynthesis n=1 Tax=Macellibacteroides fermentans TaxID=879969 RepID=A0A8E2A4R9_9PORP|nr:glycosyltransferase family 2 protein [Macellibacteroides fermentans]NYI50808.1 glycosyltransferase involved in cell wall biosynthesis [Macellibacteroides fermentans]